MLLSGILLIISATFADNEAYKFYNLNTFSNSAQTPALFGVALKKATRKILRKKILEAGASVKKLNDDPWTDIYNPKRIFPSAHELVIHYTKSGTFVSAIYYFTNNDSRYALNLLTMIKAKYGEPNTTEFNPKSGKLFAMWVLAKHNITVSVFKEQTNSTLSLSYQNNQTLEVYNREQQEYWLKKDKLIANIQPNAY